MTELSPEARAIVEGIHSDPFRYLGPHVDHGNPIVRAFLPGADEVAVVEEGDGEKSLHCIDAAGLFEGPISSPEQHYRLKVRWNGTTVQLEDPYRFPPVLSDFDLYLLGEGTHLDAYEKLGAHPMELDGVAGVGFSVLAPNARRVSVVGDFNYWDGRRHAMRVRGNGFWEIFIPGATIGQKYKFEIAPREGGLLIKSDPYAFEAEVRPDTASVITDLAHLPHATAAPPGANRRDAPISIYEVHLGSWRRKAEEGGRWLSYRELAEVLPAYVADMGFTHVEFLPVMEHPFDGSWGYQPTGLFAPTSRFGTPADFVVLIDAFHRAGVAVILDWVPGHFPDDPHALGQFDGTALYEHADPQQGRHLDWNTLIYNFGRREVANFLLSNALFWLDHYGVDGLRVDAVASMLYLDYSRPAGGWRPNKFGGRENLEAIDFIRRFNAEVFGRYPEATTLAEESTAWPMVSRPTDVGGLGFGYKWNMGWMHDTLNYISRDPIYRRHHHGDVVFGLHYAFFENFVLPLSHDEVVHGKSSLIGKMPGDDWQKFANLRALFGYMWTHPRKKLLFMGGELAQWREWQHDFSLDWDLLEYAPHRGLRDWIGDLNACYRREPSLYECDFDSAGFEWVDVADADNSVLVYLRRPHQGSDLMLIACNFTPVPRTNYRIGVPRVGHWHEILNSDAPRYGGSGMGNFGGVDAAPIAAHGRFQSINVILPPLAVVIFKSEPQP